MFKHILVPTDGSVLSNATAVRAVRFAKEIGAKLTFYFAMDDLSALALSGGGAMAPSTFEQFEAIQKEQAKAVLASCSKVAEDAGIAYTVRSEVNPLPYQGIIDAAASLSCDLIFMASHGRRGLNAVLLGSETNKVLTHSTIPVLVYR